MARAETSQKEQMRKDPSLPDRPSSVSSVRYRRMNPTREPHRNSNFGRRALRPAVDGTLERARATAREPVKPGLTFHGLRHGHKTWMIAHGVPEVAQVRRLGHILGDRIQETSRWAAGPLAQSRRG